MPYYRCVGEVPRKRHTLAKRPGGGGYLAEELMGQAGFAGESALLYHLRSPSAITAVRAWEAPDAIFTADRPLTPRHLRTPLLASSAIDGVDPVTGRTPLLGNGDVVVAFVAAAATSPLYRNALGDEVAYLQRGRARLETSFGTLELVEGDYVVIPAAVTHRWVLDRGRCDLLVLEAGSHVGLPARYLSPGGQLREGAPFSERDLRGPAGPLVVEAAGEVEVLVRNRAGLTAMVHAHHPFDVIGWDGCLYPFAFSIHDFEPVVGALHQPPPVHETFAGRGFVVSSFVPRPYDFHPEAAKVPYHHANVDSDEVLFYAAGDFMSRAGSGIGVGSISYHPAGFVHGPQPGSLERALQATATSELAVMVDTFAPLGLTGAARGASDDAYPWTWAGDPRS
jgi:homogentisate 1,2-dioxygenase